MKKDKYEDLVNNVFELIGGKENAINFTHCVTRLRFNIKDKSLVKEKEIQKFHGVVGTTWSGEQFQIIIGQQVNDVYDLICKGNNLEPADTDTKIGNKKKITLSTILESITGCITPMIPALIGVGMIKILLLVLTMTNILSETSSTYQILSFASDAVFYFFPVFIGNATARKFGGNPSLGMLLGAILVAPAFVANVTNGASMDILGIPVYATSYTQTVFPAILSVFVMCQVEKLFAKYSPKLLRSIIEPLGTLLVMLPLMLCLLAPIGAFMGTYMASAIMWIYNTIGFLGVGLLSCFLPFLILTGMHYGFMPYWLGSLASVGYEPIYILSNVIYNINQGIACLAVSLKTKDINLKGLAASAGVTAIVAGVSEPALFGVTLRLKTPLWCSMIGCFAGGVIAGACNVLVYAIPGTWGILSLPIFIDKGNGLISLIIALIASSVITFGLTLFVYKDESEE